MARSPERLLLADGWRQVEPVETGRQVVWNADGELLTSGADFAEPRRLGRVGGLNCPIVFDDRRGVAYCASIHENNIEPSVGHPIISSGCRMEEFELASGGSRTVVEAPDGYDFLWILQLLPDGERLISYLSPDEDRASEEQLAFIELPSGNLEIVPVTDKVSFPRAVDGQRERILFQGSEGVYLVNFQGEITAFIPTDMTSLFVNGSFNRVTGEVAIGAGGIYIWDERRSDVRKIYDSGDFPVWSPDGKYIWFSKDDSDLWLLDIATSEATRIVKLEGNIGESRSYGRSVAQTSDGRYLLAQLTRRFAVSDEEAKKRRTEMMAANLQLMEEGWRLKEDARRFDYSFVICVVDVVGQCVWQQCGYAQNLAWAEA